MRILEDLGFRVKGLGATLNRRLRHAEILGT